MNKIFKTISISAIALAATSCLELEPKEQLAEPDMWNTPEDFQLFANQMYGWTLTYGDIVYDGIMSDKRSDIIQDKGSRNTVSNGTNVVPTGDGYYGSNYSRIRRCNMLIDHAADYSRPADIAHPLGMAYYFRAYCHSELVRMYGDAIIVDHVLDTDDGLLFAKRNDRAEVIKFAIEDLKKAAELLKPYSEIQAGDLCSEAANALLARIALREGTWQKFRNNETEAHTLLSEAATAADKVIASQSFKLFYNAGLGEKSYKYMFLLEDANKSNPMGLTKKDNTEYIFVRHYDPEIYRHNQNLTVECLNNAQIVSRKMAQMYLCQDGLPIEKSKVFQGYEKRISEWLNRDNRMHQQISRPGDAFWGNTAQNCRVDWLGEEADLAHCADPSYNPTSYTRYMNNKWAAEHQVESRYESYDYPIIRYAEVLLTYAEAVYERDGAITDDDLDKSLNLVRLRVNPEMPKLSNDLVNKNGLSMRQEIRRERTVEFYNEGFRLDDLKRWNEAKTEMPKPFLGVKWEGTEYATKGGTNTYPLDADGCIIFEDNRQWETKNDLYPLPIDQLQLNPNLEQNPGWK